jgi:hypothetical protein
MTSTVELYDKAIISRQPNVTDPKEALELLGRFPFGQAGLMEFQSSRSALSPHSVCF